MKNKEDTKSFTLMLVISQSRAIHLDYSRYIHRHNSTLARRVLGAKKKKNMAITLLYIIIQARLDKRVNRKATSNERQLQFNHSNIYKRANPRRQSTD